LIAPAVRAEQPLFLTYPPPQHQTTADRIFLIGTAPPTGEVQVNGRPISRSAAGHFAPSLPLQLGPNRFTLRYQSQELTVTVTRVATEPEVPTGAVFGQDSLTPAVNLARQPGEWVCLGAIAATGAVVSVKLGNQTIALSPAQSPSLPANAAVLTQQNQPRSASIGRYQGCTRSLPVGDLGQPQFQLTLKGQTSAQAAPGRVKILAPTELETAEVTATAGVARTGPSSDYSRLTPLPQGTQASVTGYEGDWARLDYGAWIKRSELKISPSSVPPTSLIRSVRAQSKGDWTEIAFPLQVPVPVSVQQSDRSFTLTLFNTTAQTDTIKLSDDPLISRLDWQQTSPGQIQYRFQLKSSQQWGYKLRYEGTTLILSLRHPPAQPQLRGLKILLDPGHGGLEDLGSRGPTGYPEKAVVLKVSQLLRDELVKRGATVVMTRDADVDVGLQERVALIQQTEPTIALSLHYNALPDSGDAVNTQGVGTFWYQPQSHSLAHFLHNYLVQKLDRPSYGVFWNNLALTRPTVTPSVLLELGFMINPTEFEWVMNSEQQQKLALTIADGIAAWLRSTQR
jgi:N-acetylmuramoyl-L-alanine amidase